MPFLLLLLLFGCLAIPSHAQDPKRVNIVRDEWGTPHIFGQTNADVAYGLGWAHCEDDFFNIQNMMLLAKGKMGLISGISGATMDYFVQWIRAADQVPDDWETIVGADYAAYLKAYVAAINDYAVKHPDQIRAKGTFPGSAKDVLVGYHIVMAAMCRVPDGLKAVIAGHPDYYYYATPGRGSNAFAYNSRKTTDGQTYLVIDPHLDYEGASTFYEAHLHSEEGLNFHGAHFPGASSPGLGVNEHLGWSHTSNWPDLLDIYELEINPKNRNQYKFDGEWLELDRRKAKLSVKLGGIVFNVGKETLWCKYGPAYRTKHGVYAFRYVKENTWRSGEQWYRMSMARTFQEFQNACKLMAIVTFNMTYADREDNIYFLFNGQLPIRDAAYDWQKCLPGNTSRTLWNSVLPFEKLPQVLNPSAGYVYNTNNYPFRCTGELSCPSDNDYPDNMGLRWNHENNRDFRYRELIATLDKVSEDDMRRIKNDVQYPSHPGSSMRRMFSVIDQLKPSMAPDVADCIRLAKSWDFRGDTANRAAPLILLSLYRIFTKHERGFPEIESGFHFDTTELIQAFRYFRPQLIRRYGRIDPMLAQVQRLWRGKVNVAIPGLPECLAPTYVSTKVDSAVLKPTTGDTYVAYARFGPQGLNKYETVVPFGSSNRPDSPHHTDQMRLFCAGKTKAVQLDRDELLRQFGPGYHPGETQAQFGPSAKASTTGSTSTAKAQAKPATKPQAKGKARKGRR